MCVYVRVFECVYIYICVCVSQVSQTHAPPMAMGVPAAAGEPFMCVCVRVCVRIVRVCLSQVSQTHSPPFVAKAVLAAVGKPCVCLCVCMCVCVCLCVCKCVHVLLCERVCCMSSIDFVI